MSSINTVAGKIAKEVRDRLVLETLLLEMEDSDSEMTPEEIVSESINQFGCDETLTAEEEAEILYPLWDEVVDVVVYKLKLKK